MAEPVVFLKHSVQLFAGFSLHFYFQLAETLFHLDNGALYLQDFIIDGAGTVQILVLGQISQGLSAG